MNRRQTRIVVALGASIASAQLVPAQVAEPIAVKKYVVYPIVLPFNGRVLGIDDAGTLVATMGSAGGFIYRHGDLTIEPWAVPGASDVEVTPIAVNSRGEVVVNFGRPKTGTGVPPWHATQYIYSPQQKTYRPVGFAPQYTVACKEGPVVSYNNAGQMFCSAASVTPSLGPAGSFDNPPTEASRNSFKSFVCPDHALSTLVYGSNDKGLAIGGCFFATNTMRGFVYDTATDTMKLIDYPGAVKTIPGAITAAGQIIGSYTTRTEKGAFIFDGSHFTRLEGVDAYAPGKQQSMAAFYYVSGSRGEIIGIDEHLRTFIAVPAGQPEPPIVQILGERRIAKLKSDAINPKPTGTGQDPNLPPQGVHFQGPGVFLNGGPTIIQTALGGPDRYVGFNEQGSWFVTDVAVYSWNMQLGLIAFPVADIPKNIHMPGPPENHSAAQQPVAAPAAPTHGNDGKLWHPGDGNSYLSYTVPGYPPTPMSLKVVRPTNLAPAELPPAHVDAADTGSWVYIGEGAQAAIAALMNLDASGQVTWTFMTPAMMKKYLGQ
ncbi:MAG TPA: hypothetical protein VGN01_15685 [Acidobacteriaceae bacterium]